MTDRSLRQLLERQQALFAEAKKQGEKLDHASFQEQAQALVHDYEVFLRNNSNSADGYAAYGYLLGKVDMRRELENVANSFPGVSKFPIYILVASYVQ